MNKSFLFDVDGVLTDPVQKRVTEPDLFDSIITLLTQKQPIGLNTGRSTTFMMTQIVTHLLEKIHDKSILKNFIAIGEKGGTWIDFDETGSMIHGKEKEISMPDDLLKDAKNLVDAKYKDSMFFDDTKETMLSIEMHDGFDLESFHRRQKALEKDLVKLLERKRFADKYKIDPTTIATDVESPIAGKAYGAQRFLNFIKRLGASPEEYITLGDSASDFPMADELAQQGEKVTMIYVGDRSRLKVEKKQYPIKYFEGYAKGTLTYLQSILSMPTVNSR